MRPLETKLVFRNVVDEIDLIVEREGTPKRRKLLLVRRLWGLLPETPN